MATASRRLRSALADPAEKRSIGTRQRMHRWAMLRERFPQIDHMRVLDLGGTATHWIRSPARPVSVVVMNLSLETSEVDWITTVQGDACAPPPTIAREQFDLVYSNSVIEHVGGHARRCDFADGVRALGSHHWVQTPYRYFPLEPHWLFPGLQFLPQKARAAIVPRWPLSPAHPTGREALSGVLETELLSRTEMEFYFPSSEVIAERFLLATKSLIAVS